MGEKQEAKLGASGSHGTTSVTWPSMVTRSSDQPKHQTDAAQLTILIQFQVQFVLASPLLFLQYQGVYHPPNLVLNTTKQSHALMSFHEQKWLGFLFPAPSH